MLALSPKFDYDIVIEFELSLNALILIIYQLVVLESYHLNNVGILNLIDY